MQARYQPWWMPTAIIGLLILCVLLAFALVTQKVQGPRVSSLQVTELGAEQDARYLEKFEWQLVTTWPKKFPGLGLAPENFARLVNEMSHGRLTISVHGANEIVPALGVFGAVSSGSVEMGHSSAYYWKGKIPASPFFTSVPFGMNAQELNGWLHYGGGIELWREVYASFNLIPFAGGNTGVQMGGWFNREINSIEDIQGLKMRIPGYGGEIITRAGGEAVNIPGGELYTALQTGVIDATEWVGPYNDLAFGFQNIAKYYYYPGWHEPGPTLEFIVNRQAYDQLPKDLQTIVEVATRAVNQDMLDEYTSRSNRALVELTQEHDVELREFPEDVINRFRELTFEYYDEMAKKDETFAKVYSSYKSYLDNIKQYHELSEKAYYNIR